MELEVAHSLCALSSVNQCWGKKGDGKGGGKERERQSQICGLPDTDWNRLKWERTLKKTKQRACEWQASDFQVTETQSRICFLGGHLALWPWTNHLSELSTGFPICNSGTNDSPYSALGRLALASIIKRTEDPWWKMLLISVTSSKGKVDFHRKFPQSP